MTNNFGDKRLSDCFPCTKVEMYDFLLEKGLNWSKVLKYVCVLYWLLHNFLVPASPRDNFLTFKSKETFLFA